jgi:uncharacterized tellurite resistance protein B-like protein
VNESSSFPDQFPANPLHVIGNLFTHSEPDGLSFVQASVFTFELNLKNNIMQELQTKSVLEGYSDQEKGAYLGAIASLATADRSASEEERQHIAGLADDAGLSEAQKEAVLRAATDLTGQELKQFLDILRNSDLRFSLVTDLIAFAESDGTYSEEERQNVQKITEYLGIDKAQYSLLDQFVHRTAESTKSPEEIAKPGFLESLGLKDQFSKAGINLGSMGRGLLGFLGPMLLGGMMGRMSNRGTTGGLGMGRPGGMRSGIPGLGGIGGFGSIISALGGRRSTPGIGNSGLGGILSRILR